MNSIRLSIPQEDMLPSSWRGGIRGLLWLAWFIALGLGHWDLRG
jgi:hypothetical protein